VGDDVFQLDELVNPYRVALSNYLEENSKFCIAENTFINVDIEELKDVLRTNKYTQVDEEDDRNEINV
jgi:regulator of replication initiation timing